MKRGGGRNPPIFERKSKNLSYGPKNVNPINRKWVWVHKATHHVRVFKISAYFSFFWHFTVKFGLSGGIPKLTKFGRNLAITLPEMVKTLRKLRQNDRQSTSVNFYFGFAGKKSIFNRFIAKLRFFCYRPHKGSI